MCPECRGRLRENAQGADCAACGRRYARHHGILDLRVFPDPYLGLDEDRARADRVVEVLDRLALPELLEHYWSLSASTPPSMRPGFVRSALRAPMRARRVLDRMEADGLPLPRSRVLEIGSGTGAFLAEAGRHLREVTGLDIALRWLHVSRRRFRDRGQVPPPLVCACAEGLPFEDETFDAVVILGTLEFVRDVDRVFVECARVLRRGGRAYLTTANRHTLGPQPHVRLWGVGWLPRARQAAYVRWRGRGDFENVRVLSFRELDRLAARHFRDRRIEPAEVPEELRAELSGPERLGAAVYGALAAQRLFRPALRRVAPEWDVTLTKSG